MSGKRKQRTYTIDSERFERALVRPEARGKGGTVDMGGGRGNGGKREQLLSEEIL